MQPVYQPERGDLERKLASSFPDESERATASRLLSLYGEQEWHMGVDRVRIAAPYNSEGDLEKLRAQIELADIDHRDVIATAEYRSFMWLPSDTEPGSDAYEEAVEDDSRRYREWIDS